MNSALNEILTLRKQEPIKLDYHNRNRYRIIVKESVGKTSYCFSTPIYKQDGSVVRRDFTEENGLYRFEGSNARVVIKGGLIVLQNSEGSASFHFPFKSLLHQNDGLVGENVRITPTFNGLLITAKQSELTFDFHTDCKFERTRYCEKSFAVMQEEFRPFCLVSPLYAQKSDGTYIPLTIEHTEEDHDTFGIVLSAEEADQITFEIALYEPKLFQDTTVDSRNPDENNAYGVAAWIGRSEAQGEQWLYSRPDFSKVPELYGYGIRKILLHIPCHQGMENTPSVYAPEMRFCSFGSTWNNKIGQTALTINPTAGDGYLTIDVSNVFMDTTEGWLRYTEGLILRPNGIECAPCLLSTADSYAYPQILEVQYDD